MSKPVERYRQSDVTFWGIAAIAACGIAVSAGALPAILPNQVFTALHASALSSADVNNLKSEVSTLADEASALKVDNAQLVTRLRLAEQDRIAILKRVGALENTLPLLVEQIPPGLGIDASILTSSIDKTATNAAIPGGSVAYSQAPLYPEDDPETEDESGMPPPAATDTPVEPAPAVDSGADAAKAGLVAIQTEDYGLAMGGLVTLKDAYVAWLDLRNKIGALLIGLDPILSGHDGSYHIVAGPIDRIARAEELCGYVQKAGLQCLPVPYTGYKLPM